MTKSERILKLIDDKMDHTNADIEVMDEYLSLRMSMDDLHGVQDAASDLRELHAKVNLLKELKEDINLYMDN